MKGGGSVSVNMIRDLHSAMEREKAPIGVFVTAARRRGRWKQKRRRSAGLRTNGAGLTQAADHHARRAVSGQEAGHSVRRSGQRQAGKAGGHITSGQLIVEPDSCSRLGLQLARVFGQAGPALGNRLQRKDIGDAWEAADGMPAEVAELLRPVLGAVEPLIVVPEHRTPLPGGRRENESDVFMLGRYTAGTVACTIEGKVEEPFGPTVGQQMVGASPGHNQRMAYLCERLGLPSCPNNIHYQLLHRMVSALIEADRFNATDAAMIVHSFSPTAKWLTPLRVRRTARRKSTAHR